MTIPIKCNGKLILYTQNSMFDLLHNAITEQIEEKSIAISPNIQALLNKTDQGIYGPGGVIADIADYLKTKEDALVFAKLVEKAIENKKAAFSTINQCTANMLNFHEEILKYANTLPQ